MAKKMFDILPPKMGQKTENTVKKSLGAPKKKKDSRKEIKAPKKEKHFPLREVLAGAAVVLFLLAAYGITKLPKADIQIWPKQDTLTLSQKITADRSVTAINSNNSVIPAGYLEEIKEASEVFEATGSASNEGKATGTIKIYNKTNSVFTLIKGTHFLSDSGKYFVTLARISIPAAKGNSPGSIDAQVQAEESGTSHNIKPSKFSVPKLYGTSYYYNIYGESNNAMSGGYTGNVKKVTSEDIKQAKDALTKKLLQDARDSLKSKLLTDDVLLDSTIESSVIEAAFDVNPDAITDTFHGNAKVKVFALVFKKQNAQQLVKNNILANLPKNNGFLKESLHISYHPEIVDIKGGKLTLSLQSSVKTYYNIDTDQLNDLFSMKSGDQIKQVIDKMYDGKISQLKIDFWPFWVHKAPGDKDRIKTNLLFE